MDSLTHLRETVTQVLQAQIHGYWMETLRDQLVRSEGLNRFLVIRTGWHLNKNHYALIQDVELRSDGYVVIHADNTDENLAEDLVEAGIPADKIIESYDPDQAQRLRVIPPPAPIYRQAA